MYRPIQCQAITIVVVSHIVIEWTTLEPATFYDEATRTRRRVRYGSVRQRRPGVHAELQ